MLDPAPSGAFDLDVNWERGPMLELIISLASGAAGGNIAGALLKNQSLGTLGNSIAGIVGGGVGGQIISAVLGGAAPELGDAAAAATSGGLDIGAIIGQLAGGTVGGGGAMMIVGLLKNMMSKS